MRIMRSNMQQPLARGRLILITCADSADASERSPVLITIILASAFLWLVAVRQAFRPTVAVAGAAVRLRAGAQWWILGAVLIPMVAFVISLIATLPAG